MSIDFDSAALQTQHEEEEYDQEDYAREQELHKLLTDLPDDMLEDSRDSSSPELEYSTCSNKNTNNSPQSAWTQQWSNNPKPNSHEQHYEANYNQGHGEIAYEEDTQQMVGPQRHPVPHNWSQEPEDSNFTRGDYTYTSLDNNDFSEYEPKPYPESNGNRLEYNGEGQRNLQNQTDHNPRNQFESGTVDRGVNQYKASYNPHPAHQPKTFNSQAPHPGDQFDRLQREFLDSTQQTADKEQLAQQQILNKAQQRQIEDLEQKLEDSRRNMRYLEHQFAIVKDERESLVVNLKESRRLVEEAKEQEGHLQNKVKALEQQIQVLTERDHENTKKQRVAEAAVDSMKQQMLELCRSDTLSRTREQHDRDLAVMKEQHEVALLALQQKLDSVSQALTEQTEVGLRLREQLKKLERQREEEQLERARIINALTQRLEESQQQCAKLLQTNSVQEMSEVQIKLQQVQSAKALSENMNKVLQEDLADLKEQITLYESAVKHGVIALDLSNDCEHQLSESCMDLGLKKGKNCLLHSTALGPLSDPKSPKDEAAQLLRLEMQRCLNSLKGKRQKIGQLQEELQRCQSQMSKLQTQLEEAKLSSEVREKSQIKPLDLTEDSKKELVKLQEEQQHWQEQLEVLEKKNKELKQSEERVKSANLELCTKMREMIQELDQEKQEAAQRAERIHQQYRDDVVNRVKTELMLEHDAQIEELTDQHQQQVQQLKTQLSEVNDKLLAVQECYISVCKEKDMLEERVDGKEKEDALVRENELKMKAEMDAALENLRAELEAQHQTSTKQLKALWSKHKEAEVKQQVNSQVASVKAACQEEVQQLEISWTKRLEEAGKGKRTETGEVTCQTDEVHSTNTTFTAEELEARLCSQKHELQLEAEKDKRKAVEEARRRAVRELQEKHLEDMAKQVEGAVARAYSHWTEDLASLPEYQACIQREKAKWEELHGKNTEQQVARALREAEEQWLKKQSNQVEHQRFEELQEDVASLQSQLEHVKAEQAALLKAELAAARTVWNRDKQQEISVLKVCSEQLYQSRLQEQHKKLEQVRDEAERQRKELLLQMEAKLQETLRSREEELRSQQAEKRRQIGDGLMTEVQSALADVQAQLLKDVKNIQQVTENSRRSSGTTSETTVTHVIHSSCKELVSRAVSEAKREWMRISEERLSRVLKEAQEQNEREMDKVLSSLSQRKETSLCRKECTETLTKLQKKNQELHRHLEKACRQLQHSVREHKAVMQNLKDEHERSLEKTKHEYQQQLQEVKKDQESRSSDHQQNLQQGLDEIKHQYLMTVEKIRADMMRYLQESRERAAEMIRVEVQRERQDTARKMRRYYLSCLQELLEDGGKTTGAEKKIMNAASKLAAMAKVLETPTKNKCENYGLQSRNSASSKNKPQPPESLDVRAEEKVFLNSEQKKAAAARTKPVSCLEKKDSTVDKAITSASHKHLFSDKETTAPVSVRSKDRELYLQGLDSNTSDPQQNHPSVVQAAPVRDDKQTDWSMNSTDSDTSFHIPRLSYSGRKVEPVKPFSVSSASALDFREFDSLSPDASDLTLYNDFAKRTPQTQTQTLSLASVKMSSQRGPIPGSEAEKQRDFCPRPLYSELRQRQQDSGFDSPLYQQTK